MKLEGLPIGQHIDAAAVDRLHRFLEAQCLSDLLEVTVSVNNQAYLELADKDERLYAEERAAVLSAMIRADSPQQLRHQAATTYYTAIQRLKEELPDVISSMSAVDGDADIVAEGATAGLEPLPGTVTQDVVVRALRMARVRLAGQMRQVEGDFTSMTSTGVAIALFATQQGAKTCLETFSPTLQDWSWRLMAFIFSRCLKPGPPAFQFDSDESDAHTGSHDGAQPTRSTIVATPAVPPTDVRWSALRYVLRFTVATSHSTGSPNPLMSWTLEALYVPSNCLHPLADFHILSERSKRF